MSSNKYIISPDRLSQQLTDPNIVIIDCRFSLADINLGKSQYDRDHISGAYYLDLNQDLSDLNQENAGRHPLPNIEKFVKKLASASK